MLGKVLIGRSSFRTTGNSYVRYLHRYALNCNRKTVNYYNANTNRKIAQEHTTQARGMAPQNNSDHKKNCRCFKSNSKLLLLQIFFPTHSILCNYGISLPNITPRSPLNSSLWIGFVRRSASIRSVPRYSTVIRSVTRCSVN